MSMVLLKQDTTGREPMRMHPRIEADSKDDDLPNLREKVQQPTSRNVSLAKDSTYAAVHHVTPIPSSVAGNNAMPPAASETLSAQNQSLTRLAAGRPISPAEDLPDPLPSHKGWGTNLLRSTQEYQVWISIAHVNRDLAAIENVIAGGVRA